MSYLKIANKGEMEVEALTLLGGTSKRNDNSKIGMFGSGNKYALAYLLRNGHVVRIFSGTKEITVDTVKKTFRGEDIHAIVIDGMETSITTDSGPKWKFWYAIREIYSNALDEGLIEMNKSEDVMPFEGETHFYIKWDEETEDFYRNLHLYFSKKRKPFAENEFGQLYLAHEENQLIVYRKGIRCYYETQQCLFNYGFENIKINESRVIIDRGEMIQKIQTAILSTDNPEVVTAFYNSCGNSGYIEQESPAWSREVDINKISDLYVQMMPKKYLAISIHGLLMDEHESEECYFVQPWFYELMCRRFGPSIQHPCTRRSGGNSSDFRVVPKTPKVEAYLKIAYDFFKEVDYDFDRDVKVVKFSSTRLSKVHEDSILLSEKCFDKGRSFIIKILMGHDLGIKSKGSNLSTEDFIVEKLVDYIAEQNSYLF